MDTTQTSDSKVAKKAKADPVGQEIGLPQKAAVQKFLKQYEFTAAYFKQFSESISLLRSEVVELINLKEHLDSQCKVKKEEITRVEIEHKNRIQGMSMGQTAMIQKLNKREFEIRDREQKIELLEREKTAAASQVIALREQLEAQATSNRIKQTAGV